MITAKKTAARKRRADDNNYLTKRILIRAARAGVKEAAEQTIRVMGYTVIAHDGWIVKKYPDGHLEKISRIKTVNRNRRIALD